MNDLLNTILKDTVTLTQLRHRVHILKSYLVKNLFGGQIPTLTDLETNWLKSLPPTLYQASTKDNVYQNLNQLEESVAKLTYLTIYLPFETNDQVNLNIGQFARRIFNQPQILLDIKYDPSLIAGCALSWKGIYKDYSLKARIEEKKSEVLAGFKKFLR